MIFPPPSPFRFASFYPLYEKHAVAIGEKAESSDGNSATPPDAVPDTSPDTNAPLLIHDSSSESGSTIAYSGCGGVPFQVLLEEFDATAQNSGAGNGGEGGRPSNGTCPGTKASKGFVEYVKWL